MSEYNVDVGLNLDSGGYVASMGEALNVTKQFAGVATGVGGAVVDMNKRLVGAAMSVTGFSKVSTVAVDTAAAYQVQLSKIEATSKLTGTSFDKLSKTTKGFAREFPVGMGTGAGRAVVAGAGHQVREADRVAGEVVHQAGCGDRFECCRYRH